MTVESDTRVLRFDVGGVPATDGSDRNARREACHTVDLDRDRTATNHFGGHAVERSLPEG